MLYWLKRLFFVFLFVQLISSCTTQDKKISRPRDPWAFRSVLDKQPRMLTLALDTACYAAYDLANCKLTKVWKGGVTLEGAAYTDKKNVQPVSWGTSYTDDPENSWKVLVNGKNDSFRIVNKGYRFVNNQVILNHQVILSSGDTIRIEELPEFVRNGNNDPGLSRTFTTHNVPGGVSVSIASRSKDFELPVNSSADLVTWFKQLPQQFPVASQGEYDHRGRYWMEKSDCFTCHEVDKKTVGPSFMEVAAKYGNLENPTINLIPKVKLGSTGIWGQSAMTPHPDLTDAEIREMLDYILSLKPDKKTAVAPAQQNFVLPMNYRPGFGAPLEHVHPSYNVQTIHDKNFRPRVGGLAFRPDGKLLVTTWDTVGGVYLLDSVTTGDTNKIKVKRIASGLAEPLGIEVVNGEVFVLQKHELTQLIDHDGDEIIDEYRAICNSWTVSADFHEFAFGLVYKDGYFYVSLSMAMRLMAHEKQRPDRGRVIKISKDGTYESLCYGLRTPNGIGLGPGNEVFVTDNQGEWVPANKLIHVKKNEYHGMRWGFLDTVNPVPEVALPAIYLPEDEIGNSPSEPILIKEGIFKGQMLHGDVTYGGIQRDFLEKIDGDYQGAVFRFSQGLEAGINRMVWGPDGALYIGGVGMVGGWSWKEKQFGLQRLSFNGDTAFDIVAIRAKPHGFEIELTLPLSDAVKIKPGEFLIQQWWYLPTADYGGPKKDLEQLKISSINISADRKRIYLELPGLKEKRVVYFRLPGDWYTTGRNYMWSSDAWYTLNKIPRQ
ncbi:MAG: c-type cytochrome [Chitinophagaceae bacterium]|nr:c-type cytochrome [Chitinophagaceae bacterium]